MMGILYGYKKRNKVTVNKVYMTYDDVVHGRHVEYTCEPPLSPLHSHLPNDIHTWTEDQFVRAVFTPTDNKPF